eukprot:jgi/Chrzof1/3895/Cz13g12140.t1
MNLSRRFSTSIRRGAKVVLCVSDNHASKLAYKMAKAVLRPNDTLLLLTVVMTEDSLDYGHQLLEQYAEQAPLNPIERVVLVKGTERLSDVIASSVEQQMVELVICGSHNLCITGSRDDPRPAAGSFALQLIKTIKSCPVLLVKVNSKAPYLRSDNPSMGLKVMVECQSTSRHMINWLINQLDAEKDGIFLAVTKAQDQHGKVKDTTHRMMTNFSVQVNSNDFHYAQRLYKDSSAKALPQAVEQDGIDVLAVQAPACKGIPQSIVDLLHTARTNVLVYHRGAAADTEY